MATPFTWLLVYILTTLHSVIQDLSWLIIGCTDLNSVQIFKTYFQKEQIMLTDNESNALVPINLASSIAPRIPIHQLHVSCSQTQQLTPDTPSSRMLKETELLAS